MKKLVATGTIAALMLAAASPAFAQDAFVGNDGVATGGDVQFVDASQVQAAGAFQVNEGDVFAGASDESTADASIDQSLFIGQFQLNAGLGEVSF